MLSRPLCLTLRMHRPKVSLAAGLPGLPVLPAPRPSCTRGESGTATGPFRSSTPPVPGGPRTDPAPPHPSPPPPPPASSTPPPLPGRPLSIPTSRSCVSIPTDGTPEGFRRLDRHRSGRCIHPHRSHGLAAVGSGSPGPYYVCPGICSRRRRGDSGKLASRPPRRPGGPQPVGSELPPAYLLAATRHRPAGGCPTSPFSEPPA